MKQIFIFLTAVLLAATMYAQVGIGTTTPDASAALDITSTTRGFLPPRLTFEQMKDITTLTEGLMVYCTDCYTKGLYVFNASDWQSVLYPNKIISDTIMTYTGRTWMDRDLGASRVATSSTDSYAYGDLYQWGRKKDGHQTRNSEVIIGPVVNGTEGSNFIKVESNDWLTSSDDTRWDEANKGVHDPCPDGYRVPTEAEWDTEMNCGGTGYWGTGSPQNNATGAYNSGLKLTLSGYRTFNGGDLGNLGSHGYYWSSTINNTDNKAKHLVFTTSGAEIQNNTRAQGFSVRCIKVND